MNASSRAAALLAVAFGASACARILGIDMPPLRDDAAGSDAGSVDAASPCTDTTSDRNHCGACGHSCGGDPCAAGRCQPVVLVRGVSDVGGLDVDATSVYWSSGASRDVRRAPKDAPDAATETLLARPSPFRPVDVRIDEASLVVVSGAAGDGSPSLFRIPLPAGAAIPLGGACVADGSAGLAVDAGYYYFTNPVFGGVYRAAKGSGECGAIVSGQPAPGSVVVDDTTAYFTNGPSAKTTAGLAKVPKAGGAATPLAAAAVPAATGIGTDGRVLFVTTADGRILRVEKDGSGVVEIARDASDATPVVADDTGIYWAASGDVWAADRAGASPRLLASVQPGVTRVATDRDHVYWATRDAIVRVAK